LGRIVSGVRWAGWLLGGVLVLAAMLTVATVVRLALHARRDEIEIMQLMGAPLGLLRGPLVTEGVLHGGTGTALALVLLDVAFVVGRSSLAPAWSGFIDPSMLGFLPLRVVLVLLGTGMLVGCAGGYLAARQVQ
jgi:cell division transport system permease protein